MCGEFSHDNLIMQIRLLKILALLGSGDKLASEKMYTVVGDIFRKCDSASNIGNAVLYECICCVSSIYPNPKLLEAAAEVISRFLKVCFVHCAMYLSVNRLFTRLMALAFIWDHSNNYNVILWPERQSQSKIFGY